jgi:uncharacterized protein
MDHEIVDRIQSQLREVELARRVSIPHAIESGSRAWGFPSPDSDYDCRFLYVPRMDDALSLFLRRDVIELPLTPVFDINGWELRKAIKLLLKGNAVVIEWLRSSLVYRRDTHFIAAMEHLVALAFQRGELANHYLRLLRSKQHEHFSDDSDVNIKKVFYALRAAMALRYLRVNQNHAELPMRLQDLCAGSNLPSALLAEINAVIAEKAVTEELGRGPLSPRFRALFQDESEAALVLVEAKRPLAKDVLAEADEVYLGLLRTFAPT